METLEKSDTLYDEPLLIASPNEVVRRHIRENVFGQEWEVEFTMGGAEALAALEKRRYLGLLLDRRLRDLEIRETIDAAISRCPVLQVVVFDSETGKIEIDKATQGEHPSQGQARLLDILSTCKRLTDAVPEPAVEIPPHDRGEELLPGMVGRSSAMRRIAELVKLVAPRSSTILLTGESGTGKEIVARGIHCLGPRSSRPFVVVNCAAIPEALLESELFGYNRGAFTGAVESRLGRIHAAHEGTLFLDEVGELPLTMQAKLLRFLQGGEVQRLGSNDVFRVDVRVIAATNSDLVELVNRRQFREDLFYRLTVFPIEIEPLRQRPEDIQPLCEFFVAGFAKESDEPRKALSKEALAILEATEWHGNVRELKHAVERAFILAHNSHVILAEHLRLFPSPRTAQGPQIRNLPVGPKELHPPAHASVFSGSRPQ